MKSFRTNSDERTIHTNQQSAKGIRWLRGGGGDADILAFEKDMTGAQPRAANIH